MKKAGVQCRGIRLSYGSTAVLTDVDLDVEPGEFFALLGPSGSGKSTLLRLIAGFAQAQQGTLRIDGVDVGHLPPWQRDVGMVFQNYALWPHMTVWDNVAFGLVERRVDKASLRRRVGAALELVGLQALGARRPNQLSGGQQQRVALARTVVIEPKVLLLDEPLSNLDRTLRVQMRAELLALQRRLGITTIFVTHDQEEAMGTADRMAVLEQGSVRQVGAPSTLYDHPANAFVANFVGTMNTLPARVTARSAATLALEIDGVGALSLPVGRDGAEAGVVADASALTLNVRPHALQLQAPQAPRGDGFAWFGGTVEAAEFLGEFTRYRVRVGPHALAVDRPHRADGRDFAAGATVVVGLDPVRAKLFAA